MNLFFNATKENPSFYIRDVWVMYAQMSRNQSGAEKDNRLLFEEQRILLFFKNGDLKFQPIRSRIENSRWRRLRLLQYLFNRSLLSLSYFRG